MLHSFDDDSDRLIESHVGPVSDIPEQRHYLVLVGTTTIERQPASGANEFIAML